MFPLNERSAGAVDGTVQHHGAAGCLVPRSCLQRTEDGCSSEAEQKARAHARLPVHSMRATFSAIGLFARFVTLGLLMYGQLQRVLRSAGGRGRSHAVRAG